MCYPVRCPRCGKNGWAGCGQHIDTFMMTCPQPNGAFAKKSQLTIHATLVARMMPKVQNPLRPNLLWPDRSGRTSAETQ